MNCANCKKDFPEELLSPMIGTGILNPKPICGICALALSNKIHGISRRVFQGEVAEDLRQRAIRHLILTNQERS